jgi:hypothetical protein
MHGLLKKPQHQKNVAEDEYQAEHMHKTHRSRQLPEGMQDESKAGQYPVSTNLSEVYMTCDITTIRRLHTQKVRHFKIFLCFMHPQCLFIAKFLEKTAKSWILAAKRVLRPYRLGV